MINILFKNYFCDVAHHWQIGLQDPATPIMEGIIDIHHHVFFYLTVIFIFVLWLINVILEQYSEFPYIDELTSFKFFKKFKSFLPINTSNINLNNYGDTQIFDERNLKEIKTLSKIKFSHHTLLEIIWTIIPSLILLVIAIPSFILLYSMDEIIDPAITIKAVGHQWYWSYEYSDYKIDFDDIEFDSYMIPTSELELGQLRLLEVDNPVVVPVNTHIRVILTANDVLHAWAVPSLGIKTDCVPGRLNQVSIFIKRLGTFYGQCSEICGVNHGFMPIVIKSVTLDNYINWITNKI